MKLKIKYLIWKIKLKQWKYNIKDIWMICINLMKILKNKLIKTEFEENSLFLKSYKT